MVWRAESRVSHQDKKAKQENGYKVTAGTGDRGGNGGKGDEVIGVHLTSMSNRAAINILGGGQTYGPG
jgi:hypothetical protein